MRIVQIVMREEGGRMLFQPDKLTVRAGEQVRFLLRNNGKIEHEFVVATIEDNLRHMKAMEASPDMRHEEPNARSPAEADGRNPVALQQRWHVRLLLPDSRPSRGRHVRYDPRRIGFARHLRVACNLLRRP